MKKAELIVKNNNKREKIIIELYDNDAPNTVLNFEKLANSKFYDGLIFHRVIAGFMAQGGCPYGNGTGDAGYTIKCETKNNPRRHVKGALSMAHRGKDTGSSQFFICFDDFPHLDGIHTVFGGVIENMEAAMNIKKDDIIESIRVY